MIASVCVQRLLIVWLLGLCNWLVCVLMISKQFMCCIHSANVVLSLRDLPLNMGGKCSNSTTTIYLYRCFNYLLNKVFYRKKKVCNERDQNSNHRKIHS